NACTVAGSPDSSVTSRATFGAWMDGTRTPSIRPTTSDVPSSAPLISSRTAIVPSCTGLMRLSDVPSRVNGVRQPATTATRLAMVLPLQSSADLGALYSRPQAAGHPPAGRHRCRSVLAIATSPPHDPPMIRHAEHSDIADLAGLWAR